jgi:hypothetical protein
MTVYVLLQGRQRIGGRIRAVVLRVVGDAHSILIVQGGKGLRASSWAAETVVVRCAQRQDSALPA